MTPIERLLEVMGSPQARYEEQLGDHRLLLTLWDGSRLLITVEVV